MWLSTEKGVEPIRKPIDWRTNDRGILVHAKVTECIAPTTLYAFDEEDGLAAFHWVDKLEDLAKEQVVQLRRACRVGGDMGGDERECAWRPEAFRASVLPSRRPGAYEGRELRIQRVDPGPFRFLLPAGEYQLSVAAAVAAEGINETLTFRVPESATDFRLGDVHPCRAVLRPLAPIKPAPPR